MTTTNFDTRSLITDTSSLHSSSSFSHSGPNVPSPALLAAISSDLASDSESKPPLILIPLLSASLGFSSIAFSLAVADTTMSRPFDTIPTLVAYILVFPSHVVGILVALHLLGMKNGMVSIYGWLVARRTMAYMLLLVVMWTVSTVGCSLGAMRLKGDDDMDIKRFSTCVVSAALSALEVLVVLAIGVVGLTERRRTGMPIF